MVTLDLQGCPPSFANKRGHWTVLWREKQHWRQQSALLGKSARNTLAIAPAVGPRVVTITMHRASFLLDMDNAFAAVKPVVDGLKDAGLIHDDTPALLELRVQQQRVASRKAQKTMIRVEGEPELALPDGPEF
jgi:hypothetical protein